MENITINHKNGIMMNKKIVVVGLLTALIGLPAFAAPTVGSGTKIAHTRLVAQDGSDRTVGRSIESLDRFKDSQKSINVASDGAEHLQNWHEKTKETLKG